MNRFLSITNLLSVLLFGAQMTVIAQSVQLPVIRQKGASLDISVAQEADHAIRLARDWLRENPPANTETQACALVQLALEGATPSTNLVAWAAAAGLYARTNQAQALLAACITHYPPTCCDPEALWQLSRVINQSHSGILLRNTEALDWRNDFANLLICSQRRVPSGGAYWEPADPNGAKISSGSAQPRPPACGSVLDLEGEAVLSRQQNASNTLIVASFPAGLGSTPEFQMIARIRSTAYGILALKEIHE